jgi:adenylate kinase
MRTAKLFRRVIVVTGTPGVGKTTVTQKLAKKLDAHHISITDLVKEEKLFTSKDEVRKTLVADTEKVAKRMKEILRSSMGSVIVEGHYAVDVISKKGVKNVIVLRRNPAELKGVLEKRGFKGKRLWENIAAEILDVCLLDALSLYGNDKVCEIDVSGRTVEVVVEEIISVLEKKNPCHSGIVDWLGKLDNEGRVGEFLRDF